MKLIFFTQSILSGLSALLAKVLGLDILFFFLSSLGLALYFSLKFFWQYRQFFHYAAVAQKIQLPSEGNFSRAQSLFLVMGNFLVVGLIFYYPVTVDKQELLAPMLVLYTLHLFVFMISVRVWEKSTPVLFPVIK